MQRKFRFKMPSETRRLKRLSDFLIRSLGRRVPEQDLLDDIIIAADEIATNIILHAYNGSKGREIVVDLLLNPEKVVLTFQHNGKVFDPEKIPRPVLSKAITERKPGGLGLFIINQLMDEVVYKFKDRDNGRNSITVIKYLTAQGVDHASQDSDLAR